MTPRQRKLDQLIASVAHKSAVALPASRPLPRLTSRSFRQVTTLADCSVCAGATRRMWQGHVMAGTVVVCEDCKLAALDESFGAIDAGRLAEPSAVESNRRRH
jgi:hypothetical protein